MNYENIYKRQKTFTMFVDGKIDEDYFNLISNSLGDEYKSLNEKKDIVVKQIDFLDNKIKENNLSTLIQEELKYGAINDFIRLFLDEVIFEKINNDRHNIKLNIYLNLSGVENKITKGARHINGTLEIDELYSSDNIYLSTARSCKNKCGNTYNYDVYFTYSA